MVVQGGRWTVDRQFMAVRGGPWWFHGQCMSPWWFTVGPFGVHEQLWWFYGGPCTVREQFRHSP